MRYTPYISNNAVVDIVNARQYYLSKSEGLDIRFSVELESTMERICSHPNAFTKRYKKIRAAKVQSFPYIVFYQPDHTDKSVQILRVFNTHQKPFWK